MVFINATNLSLNPFALSKVIENSDMHNRNTLANIIFI